MAFKKQSPVYYLFICLSLIIMCVKNSITITPKTVPQVFAGNDTTVYILDTINLSGEITNEVTPETINWYKSENGISFTNIGKNFAITTIAPATSGLYIIILEVISTYGGIGKDTMSVNVIIDTTFKVFAGNDTTVNVLDTIRLHGTYSADLFPPFKTFWQIGDTTISASADTQFAAPLNPGNLPCVFKVQNSKGRIVSDTLNVKILATPTADAGIDTTVGINDTINLHGTGTDTDGSIVKYEWKFDSSAWVVTSTGDTTITAPATAQSYVCSLRVTDNDGLTGVDVVSINVTSLAPTANAGLPQTVVINDTIQLHGIGIDTDGSIVKYEWTFGSSDWVVTSSGDTTITAPSTVQTYVCSLRVTDDDGLTGVDAVSINVVSLIDTDGNVYQTIIIGNQEWTVENLRVTHYNDGTPIPYVTDSVAWSNDNSGAYCYYNNDSASNAEKYGALYNWHAVNTGNLAPAGWHVPTDAEWDALQNYLIAKGYNWDGTTTGNKIAKSMAAKTDWNSSSTAGTPGNYMQSNNSSGFSALPGGYRRYDGLFNRQSYLGNWWSATENDASHAYYRNLYYVNGNLFRTNHLKEYGFSIRLVRD